MSCGDITDHDRTYPWGPVRLPKAQPDVLNDLCGAPAAWRCL
jgi:hypothetical protein